MAIKGKRRTRRTKKQSTLKNEMISLLMISLGILILISLQTESSGALGKLIRSFLMGFLSVPAYVLPYLIIFMGIFTLLGRVQFIDHKFRFSLGLMYLGYILLHTIYYVEYIPRELSFDNIKLIYYQGVQGVGGGLFGSLLGTLCMKILGLNGSYWMIGTLLVISFILVTKISVVRILKKCKDFIMKFVTMIKDAIIEFIRIPTIEDVREDTVREKKVNIKSFTPLHKENEKEKQLDEKIKILDFTRDEKPTKDGLEYGKKEHTSQKKSPMQASKQEEDIEIKIDSSKEEMEYEFPSLELLNGVQSTSNKQDKKEILHKAKCLEETLKNFGVDAKVIQVSKGPTITRYEIQPSPGVKVSKIVNLSDDIALNLAASNIRIEAPIPGKAAVGIEIPNEAISPVNIREVLESNAFSQSASKLTFVLGKDIAGNPVTADLGKMPHMLIAGATGSGKSVCINTLITSILYKSTPQEVKLLLVDPKVVELNTYNGIPHLLIPVVTDPKKASSALNWAVTEMTNRYKAFAENSVRDIAGYNKKMMEEGQDTFPKIVIIIDELADLMMVSPGQVEDSICRLAQMARAAGIHLIVATQRPSVDVITGVIKANIPSRIAFSVSSQADSRTILDMGGAEKLLGKGDMLFYPVGASKPVRVQGSFISDSEVEKVVGFVKNQSVQTQYKEDIIEKLEKNVEDDKETDEILKDAIELVIDSNQASISMLQRRFRIGYNRAARLIDAMEERNIVGPHLGSKPREVLVTKEELEQLKSKS